MIPTSSVRFITRASFVANLGSVTNSGRSRTFSARMLNCNGYWTGALKDGGRADLFVVPGPNHDKAILAGKHLVGNDGRMRSPVSGCLLTSYQIVGRDVSQTYNLARHEARRKYEGPDKRTCDSNRLQSIHIPCPVCWRDRRPAMIAPWA